MPQVPSVFFSRTLMVWKPSNKPVPSTLNAAVTWSFWATLKAVAAPVPGSVSMKYSPAAMGAAGFTPPPFPPYT